MQLPSNGHWDRLAPAIPLVLMAIALAVRLYGLSDKPLWLDEIITQRRANFAVPELITNSLSQRHFPTYFLIVRAFDAPLIDEWMLRLPSALFGAVSIFLVAQIGTEVRSRWAGIVAASLMTLAPLEVQYSQEARPYALFSCLFLLALLGLVRIGQQTAPEVRSSNRSDGQLGPWLAFAIGTIGALLCAVSGSRMADNGEPCSGGDFPARRAEADGFHSKMGVRTGDHRADVGSGADRNGSNGRQRSSPRHSMDTADHTGSCVESALYGVFVAPIKRCHV